MKRLWLVTILAFLGCQTAPKITTPQNLLTAQVVTLEGKTEPISRYTQGKPLVMVFFSTWCSSCAEELSLLCKWYPRYRDRVNFLAVNVDTKPDSTVIQAYVKNKSLPFPAVIDRNHYLWNTLGLQSLPTTIFLSSEGRVIGKVADTIEEKDLQSLLSKSSPSSETWVFHRGVAIGCPLYIAISGRDKRQMQQDIQKALQEVKRLDLMMSTWKPNTAIMKINYAAGQHPVQVPKELFHLIQYAQELSEASHGAFDITFASLRKLWKFQKGSRPPSREEVRKTLPYVNWKLVKLHKAKRTVYLSHPKVQIDLGGIAKGYIIDQVFFALKKQGYRNILVNIGGDLRVLGHSPKGDAWTIGIQHPRQKGKISYVKLRRGAVATSGDYERYFIYQGKRYHHILNPRTGFPARKCQSVTVIAPNCVAADGLATALFVMGPKKGIQLVKKLKKVRAIFVDLTGNIVGFPELHRPIKKNNTTKS